jgi:hypothetical protein
VKAHCGRKQVNARAEEVGIKVAERIAARVEEFVRSIVRPYEQDPRNGKHGPSEDLVRELRAKAREPGILTPLGTVAVNTSAPDEGNMFRLGGEQGAVPGTARAPSVLCLLHDRTCPRSWRRFRPVDDENHSLPQ